MEPQISRVELVGSHDRNVVVDLTRVDDARVPLARVQDVGYAPDQILAGMEIKPFRGTVMIATNPTSPDPAEMQQCMEIISDVHSRRFDELAANELVAACFVAATQVETRYELDANTIVRIRASGPDRRLLHVIVEDRTGQVVHEYAPLDLTVTEAAAARRHGANER